LYGLFLARYQRGSTRTDKWTYVRDDRPFAGSDPPAVTFFYSPDRSAKHPEQHLASYAGLMQADAYAGFNRLYGASRKPGPITEVACWSHARHNFFDLARLAKAPIAIEAVKRIDVLFSIEREINGLPTQERLRVRNERSRPLVVALETWLREQRAKLSGQSIISKRTGDGQLLVSVTDAGPGLPGERPERVFEAFFTTKPHGTGTGLSLSRRIIESHGGRLGAGANSGPGATFCFTLTAV
jgi:hypothetical protein